jgi:hypothetical protein
MKGLYTGLAISFSLVRTALASQVNLYSDQDCGTFFNDAISGGGNCADLSGALSFLLADTTTQCATYTDSACQDELGGLGEVYSEGECFDTSGDGITTPVINSIACVA